MGDDEEIVLDDILDEDISHGRELQLGDDDEVGGIDLDFSDESPDALPTDLEESGIAPPMALELDADSEVDLDLGLGASDDETQLDEGGMALSEDVLFSPDDDAPPLILSESEPEAIPSVGAEQLKADSSTIAALRKMAAGGSLDPEVAAETLRAALQGEDYNPRNLPDATAIALAVAKASIDAGLPMNALLEAIKRVMSGSKP